MMVGVSNMEIAEVSFSVYCPVSIVIQEPGAAYRPFSGKVNEKTATSVRVFLELENIPSVEKLVKVFDSERSWSILQDGDEHVLCLNNPLMPQSQPIWLVRFKNDLMEVTIHCSNRLIDKRGGLTMLLNPLRYPLDQLLLMYFLSSRGGTLLHAAGADVGGKGLIFPGKSGAGKSTLSRQLLTRQGLEMLSDDRMVVRKIEGAFYTFGTPWPGDAGIAVNKRAPLHGIFFIHHSPDNSIKELSPRQAFERLMPVTSIPWYDKDVFPSILDFCEDLVNHVPAFELHCRPTPDVADLLETFVATRV